MRYQRSTRSAAVTDQGRRSSTRIWAGQRLELTRLLRHGLFEASNPTNQSQYQRPKGSRDTYQRDRSSAGR